MPVNTDFAGKKDATIQRVPCDLREACDQKAFLSALEQAVNQEPPGLIYIATIKIEDVDREAADRIAWLRVNAFALGNEAGDADKVGALGEWALLRRLKGASSAAYVTPVSLVSLAPESKPDFTVKYPGYEALFDIKTTASTTYRCAYIDAAAHEKKGNPHVIGIHLNKEWSNNPDRADVFFYHAKAILRLSAAAQSIGKNPYEIKLILNLVD